MKVRKIMGVVLAAVLALGVFAGCRQARDGREDKESAKGRYLEADIDLPENASVYSMVGLEDGTIRIAVSDQEGREAVWDLKEDGSTWEKVYDMPEEWEQTETFFVTHVSLSPKGDAFAVTSQPADQSREADGDMLEAPQMEDHYYHLDGEGKAMEVPLQVKEYLYFMRYTKDGELLAQFQDTPVSVVDMETGELTDKVSGAEDTAYFGIAGDTLYTVDHDGQILPFDLHTGEPLAKDENLSDTIAQSGVGLDLHSLQTMPLLFAGGKEEQEVFYCTSKGLYRHIKDGDVTELVIDGSLDSLGNPDTGLISLEAADNDEFYILGVDSQSSKLLHYTYSKDTATVPETELRAWTLYDNSELIQNISQYQKENTDVYVDLKVGVTEENGVTASDALKDLSTEIMAGDGPDVLVLDGLPVDAYVEKGILEDLSDVVGDGEGLFTNLLSAMERDGKLYRIPLRFAIPLVEADVQSLEKIHDLRSLADTAEGLRASDPDKYVCDPYYDGAMVAAQLYDACSAAWVKEDGSIDTESLKGFYTQLARIYNPEEFIDVEGYAFGEGYQKYTSSIGGGLLQIYCDKSALNFGNIWSDADLAQLATTLADKEGIGYKPLTGQAAHTFFPKLMTGVSSKSKAKEDAKEFVRFLLTEKAQTADQGGGLPVNERALRSQMDRIQEGTTIGSGMSSDPDSYVEMTIKKPSPEAVGQFISYIREADTPALTDEIVRDAVLSQAGDCLEGKTTPEEAAQAVRDKVDLYLAE